MSVYSRYAKILLSISVNFWCCIIFLNEFDPLLDTENSCVTQKRMIISKNQETKTRIIHQRIKRVISFVFNDFQLLFSLRIIFNIFSQLIKKEKKRRCHPKPMNKESSNQTNHLLANHVPPTCTMFYRKTAKMRRTNHQVNWNCSCYNVICPKKHKTCMEQEQHKQMHVLWCNQPAKSFQGLSTCL